MRSDLNPRKLAPRRTPTGLELVAVEVHNGRKSLIVASVYRSPNGQSKSDFLDLLSEFIVDLADQRQRLVIMGDTNIDSMRIEEEYADFCHNYDLDQIVNLPTHILPRSATAIDHILVPCSWPSPFWGTAGCFEKYHRMLWVNLPFIAPKAVIISRTVWVYKRADWTAYCQQLADQHLPEKISNASSVDEAAEILTNSILRAATANVPKRTIKLNPTKSWLKKPLKQLIRRKNNSQAAADRSPDDINKSRRARRLKKRVEKEVKSAKLTHYTDLFQNCQSPKEFWKSIRNVTKGAPSYYSDVIC